MTDKNVEPVHCSMLAEDAIKSAVADYHTKNPKAKQTNLAGTEVKLPTGDSAPAAAAV